MGLLESVTQADASTLVIFNTKKAALEFFNYTRDCINWEKKYHLSTAMCPSHRKSVIENIRDDLEAKKKILVVSTQLIEAGVDGLRVGMGPGAICTTRIISGMGVPQITAILETAQAAKESGIPIIADGGINYSGDMVKAFAAGASTVMMGSMFASCQESPGEKVELSTEQVPSRFKSILKQNTEVYTFKSYRGMGSIGAMKKGTEIKSEDEFHGKSYEDRVLVAEGVEGLVPVRGTVKSVLEQAIGGIRSGMYYVGTKTISELQEKGTFTQITYASLSESHPHDILVTNAGENYQ